MREKDRPGQREGSMTPVTTHLLWGPGQVTPSLNPYFLLCKREWEFLPTGLWRGPSRKEHDQCPVPGGGGGSDAVSAWWGGRTGSVPGSILGNPWEPAGRDHSGFCVLMTGFLKLNCSAFLLPFFPA